MKEKVLSFIREHHMMEKGERIVAGVSGGADSVCMFLILKELQEELDLTLQVVHIEHGIRGEESQADARFVEELCRKWDVPFQLHACPVEQIAQEKAMTVEEAGRYVRYEAFQRAAGADGKIAVAHNANDQAETILFHMVRGTGLKGMEGIQPVRDNIIRPLLCVSRPEIEQYLAERAQEYRTDATNADTVYARNRLRHEVLPALTRVNSRAVEHINEAGVLFEEIFSYMEKEGEKVYQKAVTRQADGAYRIERSIFLQEALPVQKQALYQLLVKAAGSGKDLQAEHVAALRSLFFKQVGKKVYLPYGLLGEGGYEAVFLRKGQSQDIVQAVQPDVLQINAETVRRGRTEKFLTRIFGNDEKICEIPKKKYTKWFDYDKIRGNLQIRTRQTGDFLVVDQAGKRQKLKNYFINEKIPKEERDHIILLADGSHVVWITGMRISEQYKVTQQTKTILEVQFYGGKKHE